VQYVAGIAVCCIMSWVMARCSSVSQCAAALCDVVQSSRREACCREPQRVEARRGTLQRATSMGVAAKKGKKDKRVVVAGSQVAQGVTEWCQKFRCVMV